MYAVGAAEPRAVGGMAEALANYAGGTINIPQRSGGDYLSLTCVGNAS